MYLLVVSVSVAVGDCRGARVLKVLYCLLDAGVPFSVCNALVLGKSGEKSESYE